ncbi:hypothetical protein K0M31_017988 [Melipona bicolor]|uniref:Uncharacterized protein n=1 Tax=Melipona bicolor TaxID=60889 RepID=A0AA40FE91_9HYME|nr:hypothetical protein K0M31_017988 [Melipona bicolor]
MEPGPRGGKRTKGRGSIGSHSGEKLLLSKGEGRTVPWKTREGNVEKQEKRSLNSLARRAWSCARLDAVLSLLRTHNASEQRAGEQIRHVFKYNTDKSGKSAVYGSRYESEQGVRDGSNRP